VIACANPGAAYRARKDAIDRGIARVLESGCYVGGEEVATFERELAQALGARFAIAVASGTDALRIALGACGVGPGDEVVTVSHTAVATVAAIELAGATPVLADVEPARMTLDPASFEKALSARTRAVIPVHLYGQPADLEPILSLARLRGLAVIEDCAQAHGARLGSARVGTLGTAGCFSFYPTKNLGALGDGGALVTGDARVADRARLLREYGWRERFESEIAGANSRLDPLQAAVLRAKLPHLDADNAARARIAARYREALADLPLVLPEPAPGTEHVWHLFVIRCGERDALRAHLAERGVAAAIHYPRPVHRQAAYASRVALADSLAATDALAPRILSLPLYPELGAAEVEQVIAAIREFYA
jgi:dTDP-4-amino-4,6-dideoxygalactose transaminase